MHLTHNLFIQMFIPTKKPTIQILLQVVGYQLWAQLGSNQRPPDYEFPLFDILSALKKSGYLSYLQH
jgi:hypothetical protein